MMRRCAVLAFACWCACGRTRVEDVGESEAPAMAPREAGAPGPIDAGAPSESLWNGTYKSAPGALYIPADWKGVRWKDVDTSAGVGGGTLAFTVESSSGRVRGTLEGPLGPARLVGIVADGKLSAAFAAENPKQGGFAGTLVGTLADGKAEGTLHASLGEASALREGTFSMSSTGPDVTKP